MVSVRTVACGAVALAAGVLGAGAAAASNKIDKGATDVQLRISASGRAAVITYRAHGRRRVVVASGAINAHRPSRFRPQSRFRLVYGRRAGVRAASCLSYDGPALPWGVAACKGLRGDYWVLQSWPRDLPNYGLRPSASQAEPDLRLSHWRGPLPAFTVKQDWAYRGRFDHLYGSLVYQGRPMHGFRTTSYGAPLDRYGVLVYLDTFNSAYGAGWQRENSFVTHKPTGIFCYGFFPHGSHPAGKGQAYRATAVGPGVLPDLLWQSNALGAYEPQLDAAANAEQHRLFSDRLCRPN